MTLNKVAAACSHCITYLLRDAAPNLDKITDVDSSGEEQQIEP